MNRRAFQILALMVAMGVMSSILSAQAPNRGAKPPTAPSAVHAPPAPQPPPPAIGAPGSGPPCHGSDLAQYLQSPKNLMTVCLNRLVQLGSETIDYQVMAVNDAGFVLARTQGGNGGSGGEIMRKFVPWSAVLYYNMMPGFVQVALVRQ